jgi:CBS-domain-containing membrane protein
MWQTPSRCVKCVHSGLPLQAGPHWADVSRGALKTGPWKSQLSIHFTPLAMSMFQLTTPHMPLAAPTGASPILLG